MTRDLIDLKLKVDSIGASIMPQFSCQLPVKSRQFKIKMCSHLAPSVELFEAGAGAGAGAGANAPNAAIAFAAHLNCH